MPETIQEGRGVEEPRAGGSATVQRAGEEEEEKTKKRKKGLTDTILEP